MTDLSETKDGVSLKVKLDKNIDHSTMINKNLPRPDIISNTDLVKVPASEKSFGKSENRSYDRLAKTLNTNEASDFV